MSNDPLPWLEGAGVGRGTLLGVSGVASTGLGLAVMPGPGETPTDSIWSASTESPADVIGRIEAAISPRWVWWDRSASDLVAAAGISLGRCWDVMTVHRLLVGGWRTSVPLVWAHLHELDPKAIPAMGQLGLLDDHGDDGDDHEDPVRPDQHLRPEWVAGGWATTPERMGRWAAQALIAAHRQHVSIESQTDPERLRSSAHRESAAELLCAHLAADGLPVDVTEARRIIADAVGPPPTDHADEERLRGIRDAAVFEHAPAGPPVDLRSPADVKSLLRRVGLDLPDTRAWRLEEHRDVHPVVAALLIWRKAERISTTYGYRWLSEHVHGGRLRGDWSSCDGAAGRMTASAGLHNLPSELRPAVAADAGHVFVRADLGQIEPRVLAAVSGDPALIAATADDDLYQPVAHRLKVTRDIAKVAVLGAMYGSTTGESANALRGLEREYPRAMGLLSTAAEQGRRGESVSTFGGRPIHMWVDDSIDGDIDRARQVAAARGRFARNAIIQGAAAEFFKAWAITYRARTPHLDAKIVLCLHDELLVHVAAADADAAAAAINTALDETAYRWSPEPDVRFVADVSVIQRWSEAK